MQDVDYDTVKFVLTKMHQSRDKVSTKTSLRIRVLLLKCDKTRTAARVGAVLRMQAFRSREKKGDE